MPNNESHSADSYKRYGECGSDLHRWMDAPHIDLGPLHRKYRHNLDDLPKWAIDAYGLEMAQNIMSAHIELDNGKNSCSKEPQNSVFRQDEDDSRSRSSNNKKPSRARLIERIKHNRERIQKKEKKLANAQLE